MRFSPLHRCRSLVARYSAVVAPLYYSYPLLRELRLCKQNVEGRFHCKLDERTDVVGVPARVVVPEFSRCRFRALRFEQAVLRPKLPTQEPEGGVSAAEAVVFRCWAMIGFSRRESSLSLSENIVRALLFFS